VNGGFVFIEVVVLILLVLLSGFFSGSETALMAVSRIRIRHQMEKGNKRAERVHRLHKRPNRMLSTILLGNNLVNIAAASLATKMAIDFFGSKGLGIATGVMTLIVLVFGEIIPKGYANRHSERIALLISGPIELLVTVCYPLIKLLTNFTNLVIKGLGGEVKKRPLVTEEEFLTLVDVGAEEGVIELDEREMIEGIFEFGETTVKEVMVPRTEMNVLEVDTSVDKALDYVLETGNSRTPVYEKGIDDVKGILYTKDLLRYIRDGSRDLKLEGVLRPAYFVPDTMKLDDLLQEFQKRKIQIAMVVDEYGGTAGLVTLEDLLEEIVGEIEDVHDKDVVMLKRLNSNTAVVDARMDIEELNEAFGVNLPSEGDFETVGGLVVSTFGRIPPVGERVLVGEVAIIVEEADDKSVSSVKMIKGNGSSKKE